MTIFSSVDDPEHYMKCPPWAFCADTTIARMFKGVTTLSQLRNLRYNQDDDGPRHYYLGRGRVVYRPCDVAEWLHPEISAEVETAEASAALATRLGSGVAIH